MLTAEQDQAEQAQARELYAQQRAERQNKAQGQSGASGKPDLDGGVGATVAGEFLKKSVYYIPVVGILVYILGRVLVPGMIKKLSIMELVPLVVVQIGHTLFFLGGLVMFMVVAWGIAHPVEVLIESVKALWNSLF